MAEEDDALRERYLQLKHEKRAYEKQQEELEIAYNDAADQSAEQAQTIVALERKLREQMQLAEDRAEDAEIAAKLNEDLQHVQTELSKTKQTLNSTSSELTQVKQVLADQVELDDSDVDLDAEDSEAGGLSSRTTSDERARSEHDEPLDNQPLGEVVDQSMLLQQQEEIARLRDMLDEEAHRRASLELKVRTTGTEEDGLPDMSLADEMGGMSLADEMGGDGGSGGLSLADELSAAPAPDVEHHHHHHHHHAPAPEEEEDESLPATPPPEPEVDPLAEDERLAMRLMAEFQEEELRRRRREQELLEQDSRLARQVNLTEEEQHQHRQDEVKRRKDEDERLARQVLSKDKQDIRKRQEDIKRLAQEDALMAQQIGVAQAQQAPPAAAPRTPVANHGADALHWAFPKFDFSAIQAMLLANDGDQKKTQRELQQLQDASMPSAAAPPRATPPESFRDKQQELLRKKHLRAQQEADELAAEQAYRARMEKNFGMKQAAQRMPISPTPPGQQQQQPRKASTDFRIVLPSQERVFVALMQDDKDGNARRLGLGATFDGRMAVKCTPSAVTLNPDVRRQHKMDDHAKRREWRLREIKEVRYEAKVLFMTVWITSTHTEEFCFKLTENPDSARDAYKTIHKFMTDATDRQDSSLARDLQKHELSDHWKGIDKAFMAELRFNEEFLEVLAKETGVQKQDFRDPFVFEQQLRRMGDKSEKKMKAVQKKAAKRESKMESRNQKIEQKALKKKERGTSKRPSGSAGFASAGSPSTSGSAYGYADAPAIAAPTRLASSPLPQVPDTAAGAQHSDPLYDTDHLYATIDEPGFAPPPDPRQRATTQAWL